MSQALAVDTSTWTEFGRGKKEGSGNYALNRRGTASYSGSDTFGGGVNRTQMTAASVIELQSPGIALGLTPPRVLKAHAEKTREFSEALEAGALLAIEMVTADELDHPDFELWKSAVIKMLAYVGLISAPLVHPLQLGGLSFEWHEAGMNIEIRFRGEQDIFVVVEDAKQEISEFYGKDPALLKAGQALDLLIRRQS